MIRISGIVKIMFLWPESKYDILGDVIQLGEGETDEPTHVAGVLENSLLEATALGVRKTPLNKYANRRHEVWEISVLHPEFIDIAVHILLGRKYSKISCFSGLLRDKYHIKLPLISSNKDDCSETETIRLQILGSQVFSEELDVSGITPKDLYEEIQKWGANCIEKWPIIQKN